RRERKPVGDHKVADQQAQRSQVGCHSINPGKGQVPLLGSRRIGPRISEVDAAVGFDHDIIGPIKLPPLKALTICARPTPPDAATPPIATAYGAERYSPDGSSCTPPFLPSPRRPESLVRCRDRFRGCRCQRVEVTTP